MNKKIEKDTLVRRQFFLDDFTDFPLRYGGWAISEDYAYDLVQYAMIHQPKAVLDLGTGTTTALLGRVAKELKKVGHNMQVISVDSDEQWLADTKKILEAMKVDEFVDLVYAPIVETEKGKYYDPQKVFNVIEEEEIDLMTIDGPPKSTQKEARYPAMPFFEKYLSNKAVVLLDDGKREEEQEIVERWKNEFSEWVFEYKPYMKGGFVGYKKANHQISPIISNHSGIVDYGEDDEIINEIKELSKNLKQKDDEIKELSKNLKQKDDEFKELSKNFKEKDNEIKELSKNLEEKDDEAKKIRASKSFRLGDLFFRSIKSPLKILTFPLNAGMILLEKKKIKNTSTAGKVIPKKIEDKNKKEEVDKILVSVVMTAFNSSKYIERAMKSILNQTHRNIELIVVDDASTDNTVEIVEKYAKKDKRIKLMRNYANKGTYWCKNYGILFSKGDYVATQDSDDVSYESRIKTQLGSVLKNNADACYCRAIRVNQKGELLLNNGVYEFFSCATSFMRKELFNNIGYFDSVRFGADTEMNQRIRKTGLRINNLNQILYKVFDTKGSLTNAYCKVDRNKIPKKGENNHVAPERREYLASFENWHASEKNLFMSYPQFERKFKAPDLNLKNIKTKKIKRIGFMRVASFQEQKLKYVLSSIIQQVDKIYIYSEQQDISYFVKKQKKIHVINKRTVFDKSNTFYFPEEEKYEYYYFTLDANVIYPKDYIQKMITKIEAYNRKAIVGMCGTNSFGFKADAFNKKLDYDVHVDILEMKMASMHSAVISDLKIKNETRVGSIDSWFSQFYKKAGIFLIAIERNQDWLRIRK